MSETIKKPETAQKAAEGATSLSTLDPNASISRKLRDYYSALQEERIPDRFLDLLEKLDAAEQAQQAGKT